MTKRDVQMRQMSAIIRAKAERGERLTRDERKHIWVDALDDLYDDDIAPLVKAGRSRAALHAVAAFAVGGLVGAADKRDQLEDRIAALERTGINFAARTRGAPTMAAAPSLPPMAPAGSPFVPSCRTRSRAPVTAGICSPQRAGTERIAEHDYHQHAPRAREVSAGIAGAHPRDRRSRDLRRLRCRGNDCAHQATVAAWSQDDKGGRPKKFPSRKG